MLETIFDIIEIKIKENKEFELIEIIEQKGTTSRASGAFMFVDNDKKIYGTIGGGENEYEAIQIGFDLLNKKANDTKIIKDPVCGGDITISFTYINNTENSINLIKNLRIKHTNKETVYIFGGGHVAKELTNLLDYLEYSYVIWDDREEFANKNRFENAKQIICAPYININDKIKITENDFVLIMTKGHDNDYEVQKELIDVNAYYVGVIGSKTKVAQNRNKLKNDSYTDEQIKKFISPIGVQVGADTPKEIAISIMAELILYKSKKESRRKYIEQKTLFDIPYVNKY